MRAGIAVDALGVSQMGFQITNELNKLDRLDTYWDIIVFYHSYDLIIKTPKFAMLQELELYGFDAPVMATSIPTAKRLLNCPRATKKLFYLWELEWMTNQYDAGMLADVYMDPSIELVARSQSHAEIITDCWKEPVAIVEEFNYEQLTQLFGRAG